MSDKEPLFTLSKARGDFVVQPFKGSGKGGQKRNKTMSACRISHPASGAVAECQEERSFEQNKKTAFRRLCATEKFKSWHRVEVMRQLGQLAAIEEAVDREMKNIRIEVVQDGKWVEEKKTEGKDDE